MVAEKIPEVLRSTNNLANVEVVSAKYLSVYHILNADGIIFSQAGLKATTEWLKGDK